MGWLWRRDVKQTTVIQVDSSGIPASSRIAVSLAEGVVVDRDPALITYLASPDRHAPDSEGLALLADRLAQVSTSRTDSLIAAVAALESARAQQRAEIDALRTELTELEARVPSRVAVATVVVAVLVTAAATVAAVAQVLQYVKP